MNDTSLVTIIRRKILTNQHEFRNNCLYYTTEKISAEELSAILGTTTSEIISYFWKQGKVIGKNQPLPSDWLKDYCRSIKVKLSKKKAVGWGEIIEECLNQGDKNAQLKERPPIVSIMGHIDHGKTTLLDTIRQTSQQKKEAGGITQKISVSPIEFQGKKIIFLDTPGHSDFIKMRQRGISLTDLVVLVIEARDGIMPQAEEIINYLHEYQLPVIVFINHKKPFETDNETNLNRIKTQCQEKGLTPLDFISGNACEKESVNYLCENILLLADYKTNWQRPASGVVIDSYLHPQLKTILTELLILGGRLQEKDEIFLAEKFGLVKIIFDHQNQKISQAFPGDLVRLTGCNFPSELGDKFLVIKDTNTKKEVTKELSNYLSKKNLVSLPSASGKKNINLVLLADSQNSLETLKNLAEKSNNSAVGFSVIYEVVGKLNNFAINLAKITQSIILAFGCQFSLHLSKIFRENNLPFFSSRIIYEIGDRLQKIVEARREKKEVEKITGVAQVSHIFYYSRVGNIAGCQVASGKITRNNSVRVFRDEKSLFTGAIRSLESKKINIKEVIAGQECGIVLKGFDDFQVGDQIIAFHRQVENVI